MTSKRCNLSILQSLLFLCVVIISSSSRTFSAAQLDGESLNICDIPCVQNVYDHYCGGSRCTTGASDYGQIFALCTNTCAAAVIGEAMMQCLSTTVPDRDDWEDVQGGILEEIVSFCSGYEIEVDENVDPLKLKDTDKELRDSLFDEPETEEDKPKSKKGKKKNKKRKSSKTPRKSKLVEEEEETQKKPKKQRKEAAESDQDTSKRSDKEEKKASGKSETRGTTASLSKDVSVQSSTPREIGLNVEGEDRLQAAGEDIKPSSVVLGSIGGPEKDEIEESFDEPFDAESSK